MKKFDNPEVAAVFETYSKNMRVKLMFLRQLIFDIASATEGVGELEETLKWGSPSYLTTKPKSGTTIRIDRTSAQEDQYAMSVHCQTTLIETLKEIYGNKFKYEDNRSLIFDENEEIPVDDVRHCIYLALTYHLRKKQEKRMKRDRNTNDEG
ncbi:MAG: DUF1801 domain-containing protein [Candidatus Manganitrophaceae bacterium]